MQLSSTYTRSRFIPPFSRFIISKIVAHVTSKEIEIQSLRTSVFLKIFVVKIRNKKDVKYEVHYGNIHCFYNIFYNKIRHNTVSVWQLSLLYKERSHCSHNLWMCEMVRAGHVARLPTKQHSLQQMSLSHSGTCACVCVCSGWAETRTLTRQHFAMPSGTMCTVSMVFAMTTTTMVSSVTCWRRTFVRSSSWFPASLRRPHARITDTSWWSLCSRRRYETSHEKTLVT